MKIIPIKSMSELVPGQKYSICIGCPKDVNYWKGTGIFKYQIPHNEDLGWFLCENNKEWVMGLNEIVGKIVDDTGEPVLAIDSLSALEDCLAKEAQNEKTRCKEAVLDAMDGVMKNILANNPTQSHAGFCHALLQEVVDQIIKRIEISEPVQRRVVCAAIRNCKGEIICSARHYDSLMHSQINASNSLEAWKQKSSVEQGFIDQWDVWMSREEALEVATQAGQIVRHCGGDKKQLFSENLY